MLSAKSKMVLPKTNEYSPLSGIRYEHLVAGISGGVTSTLLLHPLDLMKIRFAVNDGQISIRPKYKGLVKSVMEIFRQEGIKGLYRGVTPNVWGAGSAWGLYFLFYNGIKSWHQEGDTSLHLGARLNMLAASEAGIVTLVITNPIWVVKTRLCLQYGDKPLQSERNVHHYRGMMDAFAKTYKYEGWRGFYKGFIPGVFGVSHGALQFMAYEELKVMYNARRNLPLDAKLSTLEYLFCASLSKLFAGITTYPYQVMRARLQDQRGQYQSLRQCVKQTWRNEGILGFYKGLTPCMLRVVPATAVTFVVYEHVSHYLLQKAPT